jgi:hypothetical protein
MSVFVACGLITGESEELPEIQRVEPRRIEIIEEEKERKIGK